MTSLRSKILAYLCLVIVLPIALVFFSVFQTMYDETLARQAEAIRRELRQLDNAMGLFMAEAGYNVAMLAADPVLHGVDKTLTSYVATTEATKAVPRPDDLKGQEIAAQFKKVQTSHPAYVDVYFGSAEGGFAIVNDDPMPAGYDPSKRPWYQEALPTPDKAVISKAYMSTTGAPVVTVARVAREAGRILGVVGVDISLGVLTDIGRQIRIGESGYVVFVQSDGVVISNPREPGQNFKTLEELHSSALSAAFRSEEDAATVEIGGKRFLAVSHASPALNWKLVAFVGHDEVVGPLTSLMWKSGAAVAAILALICLAISLFLGRQVFQPLRAMIGQLACMGSGDYGQRLAVKRRDEMGQVFEALNQTTATLEANMREITAKSDEARREAGQAREAVRRAEEAMRLAEEARIGGMMHAAERVKDVSGVIAAASGELASHIEESSQGADQQSRRLNETATAVEEMTASVLEIARNAETTASLAEQSRAAAEKGCRRMEGVTTGVHSISEGFRGVYESVSELSAKADGIGSIAQAIEDIADQTNLLALNAAIEAARAGDAGRGFAVVADEVRKLAEKTMLATKEVGEAVLGIQKGVGGTLSGMDHARKVVESSIAQTAEASRGLSEILDLFAQSSDRVRAIATAAEQQSSATEEINRSVEDINRISMDTAQTMREAARAVSELSGQSVALQDVIRGLETETGVGIRPLAAA